MIPGLEKGMATQSSILLMNRGDWWATAHGITESGTTEQLTHSISLLNLGWVYYSFSFENQFLFILLTYVIHGD